MNLIKGNGNLSSKFLFLLFFLFVCAILNFSTVNALKCKCTQSSHRTPCNNGVCEAPTGSSSNFKIFKIIIKNKLIILFLLSLLNA